MINPKPNLHQSGEAQLAVARSESRCGARAKCDPVRCTIRGHWLYMPFARACCYLCSMEIDTSPCCRSSPMRSSCRRTGIPSRSSPRWRRWSPCYGACPATRPPSPRLHPSSLTTSWEGLEPSVDARIDGTVPSDRVVDVDFPAFMADPFTTIGHVYKRLGLELIDEAERRMRAFHVANPGDKHGWHRYPSPTPASMPTRYGCERADTRTISACRRSQFRSSVRSRAPGRTGPPHPAWSTGVCRW
jgi:hypothetical protein